MSKGTTSLKSVYETKAVNDSHYRIAQNFDREKF